MRHEVINRFFVVSVVLSVLGGTGVLNAENRPSLGQDSSPQTTERSTAVTSKEAASQENEEVGRLRLAAEGGDHNAQFQLGVRYATGKGVAHDDAQAAHWIRKAADQGNLDAQFNLGLMYADGNGVPQDDAQAVMWLRKAADRGDSRAQSN
jgi:TPR repeat protein